MNEGINEVTEMSKIMTAANLPPVIMQYYNPLLLDHLNFLLSKVEMEIIPLANRKIKPEHTGRRKQFDKLLKEYREEYERKKIEQVKYRAAIKEKAKKRPGLSNAGGTYVFARMDTKEHHK